MKTEEKGKNYIKRRRKDGKFLNIRGNIKQIKRIQRKIASISKEDPMYA